MLVKLQGVGEEMNKLGCRMGDQQFAETHFEVDIDQVYSLKVRILIGILSDEHVCLGRISE